MRINRERVAAVLAAVIGIAAGMRGAHAATVFSDNLTSSTSTVGSTNPTAPTASSTNYDIVSAKDSSADVINSSGLGLTLPATKSGIVEAEALFTTTPVVLANVNDYIDITLTFTTMTNAPVASYVGLFKSGGVAPLAGLSNSSLDTTMTTYATGGAQNYVGYTANLQSNTSTRAKIQTRPAQAGTNNGSQDLVSAGGSTTQGDTGAIQLGVTPAAASVTEVQGATYTEDFKITVTAAKTDSAPIQYALDSNLYGGTTATGTALLTIHGTDPNSTPTAFGYNGFDAIGFGFRQTNNAASEIDYTSVTVSSNVVQQLLNGDANGDGHVDVNDLNVVLNHLGATSNLRSDGNFDGAATIDLNDLNQVLNNLGASLTPTAAQQVAQAEALVGSAVPEPTSLGVVAAAGLLFVKRRALRKM